MQHIHHTLSKYLLWLLIGAYIIASMAPQVGVTIRSIQLFHLPWFDHAHFNVTLLSGLLTLMLFNAGLCMRTSELKSLSRHPALLFLGICLNTVLPCALLYLLHLLLKYWHSSSEVEIIIQGLALIIAMPIAGASTAWSQNANGNIALSLGLVIISTLLSPLTTPLALTAIQNISTSQVAADLAILRDGPINVFLFYAVVLPSILGIFFRHVIGEERVKRAQDGIKILNLVVLLILNYSNASASLPAIIRSPDWDFLGLVLLIVGTMCATGFVAGWSVPRLIKAERSDRISLMYALGMNNNGSALVIAATAFAGKPMLMIPIIIYNLLQHVVAGMANFIIVERAEFDGTIADDIATGLSLQTMDSRSSNGNGPVLILKSLA